jgi:hypothetical protein
MKLSLSVTVVITKTVRPHNFTYLTKIVLGYLTVLPNAKYTNIAQDPDFGFYFTTSTRTENFSIWTTVDAEVLRFATEYFVNSTASTKTLWYTGSADGIE